MKSYRWIWAIIIAIGGLAAWSHFAVGDVGAAYKTIADNSGLPGMQAGEAPWPPETDNLKARLAADGLPALTEDGEKLHIHAHLDIFVNGAKIDVPPDIGFNDAEGYHSTIHTESADGVIHVESPVVATFTLGQFFDAWGVRFSAACIGGYCTDDTNALHVWVDGDPYDGDPRMLALKEHEEIVIAYGSTPMKDVPRAYSFEEGE